MQNTYIYCVYTTIIYMKKTRFNDFLIVRIIPTYFQYKKDLWWEDLDYSIFQYSANKEIKDAMKNYGMRDAKLAATILYQPQYDDENKFIFV